MIRIIASGRLGADAETTTTKNGSDVVRFRIAADVYNRGEKTTQWIKCSWFGRRAVGLHSYLIKGSAVTVAGRGYLDTWTGRDGDARTDLVLEVDDLALQGGRNRDDDAGRGRAPSRPEPPAETYNDDEIPF